MTSTTSRTDNAIRHGRLWGARARDWAENEEQQVPTYEEAIRLAGIGQGARVLEVGCGSGVFLRLAADRGAEVFGLDAAEALIELARERVPEADLRVGDMQFLPYEADSFDAVFGFNSFFFAADMVAALREARRVARPGAPVVIQVWGRPERCDLTAIKPAIEPFAPAPPPGASPPPPLWEPGVLEAIAEEAGLTAERTADVSYPIEFDDAETLARRMLAPGLVVEAVRESGEEPVRKAILDAFEPYRTPDGGYRLENEWHFLIARA